jgi:hypothetical protein
MFEKDPRNQRNLYWSSNTNGILTWTVDGVQNSAYYVWRLDFSSGRKAFDAEYNYASALAVRYF